MITMGNIYSVSNTLILVYNLNLLYSYINNNIFIFVIIITHFLVYNVQYF